MVAGKHELISHSPSLKAEEIVAFRLHAETARDAMKITFSFQIFRLFRGYFSAAHDAELFLTSRKPILNSARKQFSGKVTHSFQALFDNPQRQFTTVVWW